MVVTPWRSEEVSLSDVERQRESPRFLRTGSTAGTSDTGSNSVYDGGDKAQLKTTGRHSEQQPSQQLRPSATEQSELVRHAGYTLQESASPRDRSNSIDIDQHDDRNGDDISREVPLVDRIFSSLHHYDGPRERRFLPFDKLDQLVTRDSVYKELRGRLCSCSPSLAAKYRDQIWGTYSLPIPRRKNSVDEDASTHTDETSRRKLFTILVMMGKLEHISRFIESGIYDRHLPFTFKNRNSGGVSVTYTLETTTESTGVFRDWNRGALDQFDGFQWFLLAPFFSFTPKRHRNYNFPSGTILPFNYKEGGESTGGYGEVRKITIHHAHYHDSQSNVSFMSPSSDFQPAILTHPHR